VDIDQLTFTMDAETVFEENAGTRVELDRFYFNVYAHVNDPPNEQNYYLWRTSGIFEYFTKPQGDAPCMYCFCWAPISPLIDHVSVFSDRNVDGGSFKQKIAHILYDRDTKFLATAHQLAINENAFRFWNSLFEQQTSVGSIFDPTPQQIKGNLENVADAKEVVLGFFTAASVNSQKLMIRRGEEAAQRSIKDPHLFPVWVGDCRQFYDGASIIKPIEFYD
jgi:hypothetical protein